MAEQFPATQCSTCNAWLLVDAEKNNGFCRAHPPVPMFGSYVKQPGPGVPQLEFYFPITAADDWCRDYQIKGGAPPLAEAKPAT